jgi:hypothetical protein
VGPPLWPVDIGTCVVSNFFNPLSHPWGGQLWCHTVAPIGGYSMEQVSFRLLPQEGPYDFSKFESNFEKMTKYEKISHILVFRVYIREMSLSK